MPLTSLGRVSNSGSRPFTNATAAIALVNYGKITGSYNNFDIAYAAQQINSTQTVTVNLPVTNNTPCNDVYGGCYKSNNNY
jgi:hypothetical protein